MTPAPADAHPAGADDPDPGPEQDPNREPEPDPAPEAAEGQELEAVRERYSRFATEAVGRSALYAEWARGIAADVDAQRTIAQIPPNRRQAPLVFAVARMLGAPLEGYAALAAWIPAHADDLVAETTHRSLQTNEPLRAAVLLPALATIPGPLAVIEVGASAGLCLIPDRYAYRYRGATDADLGSGAPILRAELRGRHAPPLAYPEITWRAGIDLHPLDSTDAADRAFLAALVWPGEVGRESRITAALDAAASDPPRIVAGDATTPGGLADLTADARLAAPDATLVVMTPGVLPHIPRAGRDALAAEIRALGAVWISIEPAGTVAASGLDGIPSDAFVLRRDDRILGVCDPLGAWLEWRPG